MNLQTLFQDFNARNTAFCYFASWKKPPSLVTRFFVSKFLVHSCLMVFTALFALKLDNVIQWSYWTVFAPIWFWKFMVIAGALVGSYVWWKCPHFRLEGEAYVHYKAMLISLALHLILLMFDLLVCDKLESGRHLWILVFIPLIFISVVSIAICVWAVKHDRSFELELFCSVNILQFIFLALRLDGFITWSWEVVFVPLWIILCLSLVGVVYSIIFAGILLTTAQVNPQQRRTSLHSAFSYTALVLPILIFQVLLANKLDGELDMTYLGVASPLFLSYTTLILMSFGSKGGNRWWFGIRKDFCHFLLSLCPILQEYANISYSSQDPTTRTEATLQEEKEKTNRRCAFPKTVLPIVAIDVPD